MFFDEDALRQVFEQQEFKVVELVVGVCFNTIVRKVGIDLGTPLEGVAVLIAKSVEYIDFIRETFKSWSDFFVRATLEAKISLAFILALKNGVCLHRIQVSPAR
jgi:hypothetical protein